MIRALVLFLAALGLVTPAAAGQRGVIARPAVLSNPLPASSAELARYLERRAVQPSAAITAGIGSWIACEQTAGVWTLLDWIYVPTDTMQGSGLNIAGNAYPLSLFGTVTFTALHGWKGDKATGYGQPLDWSPALGKGMLGLNDAHVGVYIRTAGTAGMGAEFFSGASNGTLRRATAAANYVMSLNESGSPVVSPSSFTGFFLVSRLSASTRTNYRAGSSLGDASVASTTVIGASVILKTSSTFSDAELGYMHAGRGLTAAQVAADEQCRSTLYTAIGAS